MYCSQGPLTDKKAVDDIRSAVQKGSEATVRILNYKKNGDLFWNMLSIAPMNDADGELRFFIGVQVRLAWLHRLGQRALLLYPGDQGGRAVFLW